MVSCASEREITYEKGGPEQFGDRYMSDVQYVTDEEGNVRPDSDKRSQYDSKGEYAGAKGYSGREYSKKGYRSKRWGGDKHFNAKNYAGKNGNQFQHSPHFVRQQANAQGKYAAPSGKNYATSRYANSNASVSRGSEVARPADAKAASKSGAQSPPIYSLDQANGIGVSDTNAMMGR